MAAQYGNIQSAQSASGTSLVITKPTGLAAGDIMIAVLTMNGTPAWAASGWTNIGSDDAHGVAVLAKVASSGDAAASNFTFTHNSAASNGALFYVHGTGVGFTDLGNAIRASSLYVSGGTTATFTPGIGAVNGEIMIMITSGQNGSSVSSSAYAVTNNNPSWTERADSWYSNSTHQYAIATATASAGGDTGGYQATYSSAIEVFGMLICVAETVSQSLTPSAIALTLTVNIPALTASASLTPAAINLTLSIGAPTMATSDDKWSKQSKSSDSWNNQSKS